MRHGTEGRTGMIRPESVMDALHRWAGPEGMLRHVDVHDVVGSTNALALDDHREGLLVVGLRQTMGRGRHGSSWESPQGGLYLSYVPPQDAVPIRATDISLLAALAVAETVDAAMGRRGGPEPRTLLKWPNDVLVGDGKVAGVLVQTRSGSTPSAADHPRVVVGIGVNVNSKVDLVRPEAADGEWSIVPRSLEELSGAPMDLEVLLVDLVDRLLQRIDSGADAPALEEYRSRCVTLGKRVSFSDGGQRREGTALDIAPDGGGLLVRLKGGELIRVTAGEVRHLRSTRG